MNSAKLNNAHARAAMLIKRREAADRLANSGVVISKTGGAYRDPASIIRSSKAQAQLKVIAVIRERSHT